MRNELDDPRREFLVRALSLGLFAGGNFASLFQASYAMGDVPRKLPDGRSIYQMRGTVTVDSKQANLKTAIGPNSRISTGSNSRIIFVVANDAFLMRSNSELQMGSSGGLIIEGMRLVSGAILSVFGKSEEPRSISTLTATIGIRGTGIYVESDPQRSYVCTCYGHTRITAEADNNITEDIVSKHHDKPVYILASNAGNKLIVPAPFIDHTDAELALIEELVGRSTPYSFSGAGYEVPRKRNY